MPVRELDVEVADPVASVPGVANDGANCTKLGDDQLGRRSFHLAHID